MFLKDFWPKHEKLEKVNSWLDYGYRTHAKNHKIMGRSHAYGVVFGNILGLKAHLLRTK